MKNRFSSFARFLLGCFIVVLSGGCTEHKPPSPAPEEHEEFEVGPLSLEHISVSFSTPGIMTVHIDSSDGVHYVQLGWQYNMDFHVQLNASGGAVSCLSTRKNDTVRFQCQEEHKEPNGDRYEPAVEWECLMILDTVEQRIDSLFIRRGGDRYYHLIDEREDIQSDVLDDVHLSLKGLKYDRVRDTLVVTATGPAFDEALQSFLYYYRVRARHFPALPHYINYTLRDFSRTLPADDHSIFSLRIW